MGDWSWTSYSFGDKTVSELDPPPRAATTRRAEPPVWTCPACRDMHAKTAAVLDAAAAALTEAAMRIREAAR